MADEAVVVAAPVVESAVESSPAEASSPAAGLGASESRTPAKEAAPAVTQADFERFKASIQSSFDKQISKYSSENADLKAQLGSLSADLEFAQARLKAPDPDLQPREATEHWQKEAAKHVNRVRTEQFIGNQLLKFAQETGIVVTRDDRRLDLKGGADGAKRFLSSLDRIRNEKAERERAQAEAENQKKSLRDEVRAEVLKELGATTFDGGPPSGSADGALNIQKYQSMTSAERRELRRKDPAAVDRMMASLKI